MEYISIKSAAAQLNIATSSLHYYIRALQIVKHSFPLDRHVYLNVEDVERIGRLREEAAQRAKAESA